jgi:hypothetical protein
MPQRAPAAAAAAAGPARDGGAAAGPSGSGGAASPAAAATAPAAQRATAPDSAFAASLASSALAPPPPLLPPSPDRAAPAEDGVAHLAGLDVDVEANELRCRVCLSGTEDGPLTQLHCACRGEMAIIHEACAKRWFQRRRSGVCEVCARPAFDLPPEDLVIHLTARQAASLAHRAAGGTNPKFRKAVLLSVLAVTLGLILAGALGWMVPSLRCRRASLPAGILPLSAFIAFFHHRVFMIVPHSIHSSWHAIGLLTSVCLLVDVSILMTGNDTWC